MDTIQCAIVLAKLERFEWELDQRQEVAARYTGLLAGLGNSICGPVVRPDRTSAFAQFTIQSSERKKIQRRLQAAGVPIAIHYPVPIHLQPAYAFSMKREIFPVAEGLAERVLSLPMCADLSLDAQRSIVRALGDNFVTVG